MGKLIIESQNPICFAHRKEAGKALARTLRNVPRKNAVVLGIPRGGVVPAREIARALHIEMDVLLSHKLGTPGNPEFAIGAISENGKIILSETARHLAHASYLEKEKGEQCQIMQTRLKQYRKLVPKIPLQGKMVILTDDGVAVGLTVEAALSDIREEKPAHLILALPVGPPDTLERLSNLADETIALCAPRDFQSVSQFYENFPQVTDEEIFEILETEKLRRHDKPTQFLK